MDESADAFDWKQSSEEDEGNEREQENAGSAAQAGHKDISPNKTSQNSVVKIQGLAGIIDDGSDKFSSNDSLSDDEDL